MYSLKANLFTSFVLGVFAFFVSVPQSFADATSRSEGFYDQTYEVNGNHIDYRSGVDDQSWSGAFTYSLPLSLPPGRNGLNPSLAFSYNSQNGGFDDFFGEGWSMEFPSITRFNKTGVDNLYEDNYFSSSLDGELVATTGAPYGDYSAKIENGSFFIYSYDSSRYWTATDKSGTVYTFGAQAATRQEDPSDSTRVYRWMLEEVRDTNDNFIKYEYTEDSGQIYPSRISYTGSGSTEGAFEVKFNLEARADTSHSYQSGFEVENNYRVNAVTISFNGTWVRKYSLTYTEPDNTPRSLLQRITESAQNSAGEVVTLPPTSFSYEESGKGWEEATGYSIPVYFYMSGDNNDKGVDIADVNGDGLMDFISSGNYGSGDKDQSVYINQGRESGWSKDSSYDIPLYFWDYSTNMMRNTRMGDINGDGFSDVFYGDASTRMLYLYDEEADTWVSDSEYRLPLGFNNGYLDDQGIRLLDINGDDFPDFIQALSDYLIRKQKPGTKKAAFHSLFISILVVTTMRELSSPTSMGMV